MGGLCVGRGTLLVTTGCARAETLRTARDGPTLCDCRGRATGRAAPQRTVVVGSACLGAATATAFGFATGEGVKAGGGRRARAALLLWPTCTLDLFAILRESDVMWDGRDSRHTRPERALGKTRVPRMTCHVRGFIFCMNRLYRK
mgnify:CR=1 FL=1